MQLVQRRRVLVTDGCDVGLVVGLEVGKVAFSVVKVGWMDGDGAQAAGQQWFGAAQMEQIIWYWEHQLRE
jgi:hypothetical protein